MGQLESLEAQIQHYGYDVIQKRFDRLKKRRFVLFPFLRAKWLLRKLRILKG